MVTKLINELSFVDRINKHFGYLESEYDFKMALESNSEIRPETDGIVEYKSDTTVVVIDSETGYASVWFYRIKDGREHYLDPIAIDGYLNTTEKEKELLLSVNPKDQLAAANLFNQKSLLHRPEWKSTDGTTPGNLELYLKNYADWLKAHADLCLKGDFSRWPAFYEYKIQTMRADHLRHSRNELQYAEVKGPDGKSKLVKQSIFKNDLEHIEKLKKEFSR